MNPVDHFRQQFYETLVAEEKEKEKAQKHKERNCFHRYDIQHPSLLNGYNEWECSKCGLTTLRRTLTERGIQEKDTCLIM